MTILVPSTRLHFDGAGHRIVGRPFAISGLARSVGMFVKPTQKWDEQRRAMVALELSEDGGETWRRKGAFGAAGRNPWARIGLSPKAGRMGRFVVDALMPARFDLQVANSITIGDDNSVTGNSDTGTVSIDAGTGSDRALFGFLIRITEGVVDSFTYAGAAMTAIGVSAGAPFVYARVKTAPATGANDLVWTHSGFTTAFALGGIALEGVDQTTPNDSPVTDSDTTGTTLSAAVSSAAGDYVMEVSAFNFSAGPVSTNITSTGQTAIFTADGIDSGTRAGGASYEPGDTSVTMTRNANAAVSLGEMLAFNVNAAAGGGGPVHPFTSVTVTG